MPQKVPWPTGYYVAFSGRSPEGDVLLDYAHHFRKSQTADWVARSASTFEWWSKHQDLLKVLVDTPIRKHPFWVKSFAPCENYFKERLSLSGAVIVEEKLDRYGFEGAHFGCVRLRHSENAVTALQKALNQEAPVLFAKSGENPEKLTKLFLFGPCLWKAKQEELAADPEHFRLLFLEAVDKDRLQLERLKNKFSGLAGTKLERSREPIPESVRIFVWRRDGGRCVRCGSNERLEFDHIIPLVEGGSNTERNLQLLCEPCNRAKSARV